MKWRLYELIDELSSRWKCRGRCWHCGLSCKRYRDHMCRICYDSRKRRQMVINSPGYGSLEYWQSIGDPWACAVATQQKGADDE